MTDKTEAMDNLIAQDADLIEICPDDLVQRLRRTYRKEFPVTGSMIADNSNRLRPFPILATEVLFNPDGREAADRIQAQAAEIEHLRAEAEAHYDRGYYDGSTHLLEQHEALREALVDLLHAVCGKTGFAEAVRRDSGRMYPWPALELAEAKALAALKEIK
jgi:hypothetical protein